MCASESNQATPLRQQRLFWEIIPFSTTEKEVPPVGDHLYVGACVCTQTQTLSLFEHTKKPREKKIPYTEHHSEKDGTSSNRLAFSCKKKKPQNQNKTNPCQKLVWLLIYLIYLHICNKEQQGKRKVGIITNGYLKKKKKRKKRFFYATLRPRKGSFSSSSYIIFASDSKTAHSTIQFAVR